MSESAVSINNLGFRYPRADHYCFRHMNIEVSVGERFGIFGPNGAGKTTLMNCLTRLADL